MKLYYSPFACSLASHITCREADLPVVLERTELASKLVDNGENLFAINPMGQVPTLVTDEGRVLTESSAVLTFLADRVPGKKLAPPAGDSERYELTRWLSFLSNEVHKKCLWPIFAPDVPDALKDFARSSAPKPLAVLEARLTGRDTLLGDQFSVADAFLIWVLLVTRAAKISLDDFPALRGYYKRHLARPAVQAAIAYEREARPYSV